MTTPRVTVPVDELAQEIRRVDGNHDLGAGALAEALMPFLSSRLSAAPAPEGGAVLDAHDGDTPLQSAAREAGWALSSLIDSAPWERRGQLQGIVERLGAAIDRLVWPWPGDDVRHDEIRDAWRAYADERTDDDGKIDATEIDTCVAIGCMKAIQLLSPALATREEAPAEAGDDELIERGLRMIRAYDAVRDLRDALSATTARLSGYDWNADPDGVTKQQGDAFSAADRVFADLDAAVASRPEIELPECQTCGGTGKIEEAARTEGANQHSACIRTCDDCDGCGFAPDDEPEALRAQPQAREDDQ